MEYKPNPYNFHQDSFCSEPWSQLEISSNGDFSICCLANYDETFGMARDENDQVMNVMTHDFDEALNSKTHKDHRLQLSRNEKPQRCRNCYESEEATKGLTGTRYGKALRERGISKRVRVSIGTAQRTPGYVVPSQAHHYMAPDGTTTSRVVNLHIRFGNLCNMRCVMCSPQHSSMWYDDWIAFDYYDGEPIFKLGKYKTFYLLPDERGKIDIANSEKWWQTQVWRDKFEKIIPRLRHIYFTGGEPFVVPELEQTLDKLIEADTAKEMTLRFDTNLTIINRRILEKLTKFRKVFLCISVDDTEERYTLIRNPGNWERFIKNLNLLKEYPGLEIEYLSSCIGIQSPYAMFRVIKLCEEYNVKSNFRFLEGPKWLDPRYWPRGAKEEIIANFKEFEETYEHARKYRNWTTSMIRLLEKYIDDDKIENQYFHLNEYIKYMDILDQRRQHKWRETLHDVYELLSRHCDPKKIENLHATSSNIR